MGSLEPPPTSPLGVQRACAGHPGPTKDPLLAPTPIVFLWVLTSTLDFSIEKPYLLSQLALAHCSPELKHLATKKWAPPSPCPVGRESLLRRLCQPVTKHAHSLRWVGSALHSQNGTEKEKQLSTGKTRLSDQFLSHCLLPAVCVSQCL